MSDLRKELQRGSFVTAPIFEVRDVTYRYQRRHGIGRVEPYD